MMNPFVMPTQAAGSLRGQADVFSEIFLVFLAIGTAVGIVVVLYTLYNAYKYRETGEEPEGFDAPELGELPSGQGGGKSKKLFLSFGISAIIVISLIVYGYTLLIYVESGPATDVEPEGDMNIDVTGIQFAWQFEYPNGQTAFNTMRVPAGEDRVIRLHVTSDDVWHNFGVPEKRIKVDAIPGETDEEWFIADETGTYTIRCFELCGAGHSQMVGEIIVMEPDKFNEWYEGTEDGASSQTTEVASS